MADRRKLAQDWKAFGRASRTAGPKRKPARRSNAECGGVFHSGPDKAFARCGKCGAIDYESYEGDRHYGPPRNAARGSNVHEAEVGGSLIFIEDTGVPGANRFRFTVGKPGRTPFTGGESSMSRAKAVATRHAWGSAAFAEKAKGRKRKPNPSFKRGSKVRSTITKEV